MGYALGLQSLHTLIMKYSILNWVAHPNPKRLKFYWVPVSEKINPKSIQEGLKNEKKYISAVNKRVPL